MKHTSHLHPHPFGKIKDGTKTVEVRLLDEKRKQIKAGDTITFINRGTNEEVSCLVTNLYITKDFKTAIEMFSPEATGSESHGDYKKMYQYYSKEEEQELGVVAIEIKLIK